LIPANAAKFKAEGIQLFREVLARYADVPVTISSPRFRDLKNLGEKARKSLHGLEHLTVGSELPNVVGSDLHGRPLDLREYQGSVVVISTWFTGCGPCMAMIPQEQRLIETYKDRPFVLLGVCTDETLEQAQQTAAEHKMDWRCWFDGPNGPITRDLNILAWPTIYVLDHDGRIAAKNIRAEELDVKVAELMEENK
jgi:thiol-disulfide isomerase/thioredoxin